MKVAIIYSSKTGNTEKIAQEIKKQIPKEDLVFFGKPTEIVPQADLYFLGSFTDKGNASKEMLSFLPKIKQKQVAYFATAGYGGSKEYYQTLFERVKKQIDSSNQILGYFYCQGKMPLQVKERYLSLMTQHPEDKTLSVSLENFEKAQTHPDEKDLQEVNHWSFSILQKANKKEEVKSCNL